MRRRRRQRSEDRNQTSDGLMSGGRLRVDVKESDGRIFTMSMKRKRPRLIVEFRNLRVLPSGYQVTVTRGKREFAKHFAGNSEKSLRAAMRYRDQLLRVLPNKRKNLIPRKVLAALGLKKPVVGVSRH